MIILKLKDDTEEWVNKINRETIDGIPYILFEYTTEKGKIITGSYQAAYVLGIKDVGEIDRKKKADKDIEL